MEKTFAEIYNFLKLQIMFKLYNTYYLETSQALACKAGDIINHLYRPSMVVFTLQNTAPSTFVLLNKIDLP